MELISGNISNEVLQEDNFSAGIANKQRKLISKPLQVFSRMALRGVSSSCNEQIQAEGYLSIGYGRVRRFYDLQSPHKWIVESLYADITDIFVDIRRNNHYNGLLGALYWKMESWIS